MPNPIRITDDTSSIHAIGDFIMSYQAYQNAFVNALVNRIAMTIVTSKMWSNPWSIFKRGYMEYGETVEEVFVNIANPHSFDPATAENEIFKRELPDIRAAFHTMNYQKFYKVTVQDAQLRQAFLSWSGITDLIARIVDSLYTGMNYDEFIIMKYMCAREILSGQLDFTVVPASNQANYLKDTAAAMRAASTKLTFLSTEYNRAGVYNATKRNRQYVIIDADFEANMDVDVMAVAFHMERTDFLGRLIVLDSWEEQDLARLELLFEDDANYVPFTSAELASLAAIHGMILDEDWWMVFDNFQNMTENYNGEGLYWNYWLHVWKTFSVSPFANATVFTEETGAVTTVTVSPATASMTPGTTMQFTATVAGTGIFQKGVNWSLEGATSSDTSIDPFSGILDIARDEEAETLTVTATSQQDATKSGTATVTIVTE